MSNAPSMLDKDLAGGDSILGLKRAIRDTGRKIDYLESICESMKPRLSFFRAENVFRGLTPLMLWGVLLSLLPHDGHPDFIPFAVTLGMAVASIAGYFLCEKRNMLKKHDCFPLFIRVREIPELMPLYESFLNSHTLHPSTVRNEVRKLIQTLEKEKDSLEIEEEIFRQSLKTPWN